MLLVVMLEGNCQVAQRRFPIRFGHVRHVVTLDRLHEALCHAIALWATHRCGHRLQADLSSKQARLFSGIGRTVIAEPLHRRCRQLITEALLRAFQHQVADIIAAVPGWAGDPADGLAVTAVQGKGLAQFGAVLATELKTVRAPTCIAGLHRNTPFVPTRYAGLFDPALKQKVVITHDPVNPLHVDRG